MSNLNNKKGFSLVEMSIVIILMSLIIAASIQGLQIIQKAKIRNVIAEISDIKVSFNSFKTKYDKTPGDFDQAVSYWGATTKNGDGDGKIEFVNLLPTYEGYLAWQHLSYAGMVKDPYVGTQETDAAIVGTDVPKTTLDSGGYFVEHGVYGLSLSTSLIAGVPVATSTSPILVDGLFKPNQAHEIDNKIDDGNPMLGSVRGKDGNFATSNTCLNAGSDTLNETSDDYYQLTLEGQDCTMSFKLFDD